MPGPTIADRVKEVSQSTGTGAFALLGAVKTFRAFSTLANGTQCYYVIAHRTLDEWEVGVGTRTDNTLSRDQVLSSSNGGSAVDFSAGLKDVFISPPGDLLQFLSDAKASADAFDDFAVADQFAASSASLAAVAGAGQTASFDLQAKDGTRNSRAKLFVSDGQTWGLWHNRDDDAGDQDFVLGMGSSEFLRVQHTTGYLGVNQPDPAARLDVADGDGRFFFSASTVTTPYSVGVTQTDEGVTFGHDSAARDISLANANGTWLVVRGDGLVLLPNVVTSDPGVDGALWVDEAADRVLKVSSSV